MAKSPAKPPANPPADSAQSEQPKVDMDDLRQRRNAALSEKREIIDDLEDIYEYGIPYRRATKTRSNRLTSRVFDPSMIVSSFKFAGKLHQDMFPEGQGKVDLIAGQVLRMIDTKKADQLDKILAGPSKLLNTVYGGGEWSTAFLELATELVAGTAAMRIMPGKTDVQIARFATRSTLDMAFESDGYGDITGSFDDTRWTYQQIAREWPDAPKKIDEIQKAINDKQRAYNSIIVHQDEIYDPSDENMPWQQVVWIEASRAIPIASSRTRTKTMLTPRYLRLPGRSWGIGVGHLALPAARTANVAQELTLRAAAIALLGIYMIGDDAVTNLDQLTVEGGAFWKVNYGYGQQKPIERMPDPRIDLGNIVLSEIRQQVQTAMMDHALPPDSAGAKSAVEIMERMKRHALDNRIASGRMAREIIEPATRRLLEIFYDKKLIKSRIAINDILVQLEIGSPIATASKLDRVQKEAEYVQLLHAIDPTGEMVRALVKLEQMASEWRGAFGVEPGKVYTIDEQEQIKRTVDAMVKTSVQAAMASIMQAQKAMPKGAASAPAEQEFTQEPVEEPMS